jgi:hypothetical protein
MVSPLRVLKGICGLPQVQASLLLRWNARVRESSGDGGHDLLGQRVYGSIFDTTALGVCRHESQTQPAGWVLGECLTDRANPCVTSGPHQCRNGSHTPSQIGNVGFDTFHLKRSAHTLTIPSQHQAHLDRVAVDRVGPAGTNGSGHFLGIHVHCCCVSSPSRHEIYQMPLHCFSQVKAVVVSVTVHQCRLEDEGPRRCEGGEIVKSTHQPAAE